MLLGALIREPIAAVHQRHENFEHEGMEIDGL